MSKTKRFFKNKKGFTFVEVIAIMAIMAIATALVLPNIQGMIDNTEETKIKGYCVDATSFVRGYTQMMLMGNDKEIYEDKNGDITTFYLTTPDGLKDALNAYNMNPSYQYYVLSYASSSTKNNPTNTIRAALADAKENGLQENVDVMVTVVVSSSSGNNKNLRYTLKGFWFYSYKKEQVVYTYYSPGSKGWPEWKVLSSSGK